MFCLQSHSFLLASDKHILTIAHLLSILRSLTVVCQDVSSSSQGGRCKALGVFLQCVKDVKALPL